MKIENAQISKVSLSMADHGCLTFNIGLKGRGWGIAYGGYVIGHGYLGADDKNIIAENGHGLEAMMRIMNVVGVEKWEDLPGKYIRVKMEGWGDPIDIIGNIMEDKWFNIREFFKQKQKEEGIE